MNFMLKIKHKKLLLFLCLFAACIYPLSRFCHHQTKGFRLCKLQNNFSFSHEWELPPLNFEEQQHVNAILKQKFTYLGRGLQSFVFESSDGQYVLKIFNNRYQTKVKYLKLLPFFSTWKKNKISYLSSKLEKIFTSYHLASSDLKEETGLVFAHLTPTCYFQHPTLIKDPLGIEHRINLDQTAFLLQKKAKLVYPALEEMMENGKTEQAKKALSDLLHLLIIRCRKGISDNDPLIRTNFGFVNGCPIYLDAGPFSRDATCAEPRNYVKEIFKITTSLKHWCEERYPELLIHLNQELQSLKHHETMESQNR
jgi:hypothetical protein